MNINVDNKDYECFLGDNGTLDTVIEVNGKDIIFSMEYAQNYRDESGYMRDTCFIELAHEAIEAYEDMEII